MLVRVGDGLCRCRRISTPPRPAHAERRRRAESGTVEDEIAGEPGDLGVPGKDREGGRVRHAEQVAVGWRHVQVRGKASEPRTVLGHALHSRRRHELRALHAKEIDVGELKKFNSGCLAFLSNLLRSA